MSKKFEWPLVRHQITNDYYILVFNRANKAEVLKVRNRSQVNDFMLGMGMKTVKTFEAKTSKKAYNKAKRWLMRKLESVKVKKKETAET